MKEDQSKRYEACFELYKKYAGRKLSQIEREMRALGFGHFHRRILYSRTENGTTNRPDREIWLEGTNSYGCTIRCAERLAFPNCLKSSLRLRLRERRPSYGKVSRSYRKGVAFPHIGRHSRLEPPTMANRYTDEKTADQTVSGWANSSYQHLIQNLWFFLSSTENSE
ncbi:MAG TPA: hypothetical protein VMS29_10575, partial [Pyrinomonadaceae bacterium]|nr:hypothetical protein [Pyrinomonadaceae bacterium]